MVIDTTLKNELQKYLEEKIIESHDRAVIISAYKLNKDEIQEIVKTFRFLKQYQILNFVNKKIIGGFIIKFQSKIIDLSLVAQLNKFKKIFYEIN